MRGAQGSGGSGNSRGSQPHPWGHKVSVEQSFLYLDVEVAALGLTGLAATACTASRTCSIGRCDPLEASVRVAGGGGSMIAAAAAQSYGKLSALPHH